MEEGSGSEEERKDDPGIDGENHLGLTPEDVDTIQLRIQGEELELPEGVQERISGDDSPGDE